MLLYFGVQHLRQYVIESICPKDGAACTVTSPKVESKLFFWNSTEHKANMALVRLREIVSAKEMGRFWSVLFFQKHYRSHSQNLCATELYHIKTITNKNWKSREIEGRHLSPQKFPIYWLKPMTYHLRFPEFGYWSSCFYTCFYVVPPSPSLTQGKWQIN